MFREYDDITDRIAEPPRWWDEHGVPRYVEFSPYGAANIYAVEVALLEIACSACGRHFEVALSGQGGAASNENGRSMADDIRSGEIDYGDPPNYGNCRDGASTGCYNLRVLQYWKRPEGWHAWTQNPTLEIILPEMSDYLTHHHRPETAPGTAKVFDPSAGWDGLALPRETVDQLQIIAKMLREGDPLAPRNLLLIGPQERNKTEPVRQIARESRRPLIAADAADVMSATADQATQKVAALFAHARARTPCILFFDDFERFAARRGTPLSVEATNGVVLQLLAEMENNRDANREVFLVAATGYLDAVDSAIRSHIPLHIEITGRGTGERGSTS